MRLSRKWLDEYVKIDASDKEYADKMTMSGSKVEGVEIMCGEISKVVAGHILTLNQHENSDHLFVCTVDVGEKAPITLVTGAQNLSEGDYVPVALEGATLPEGVTIKAEEFRGIRSEGMLCSLKELGLDAHDFPEAPGPGVFILPVECRPGDDILDVCMLRDNVVEFEITSNRPDCLSVRGLARESAATFGMDISFTEPDFSAKSDERIESYLNIQVDDPILCPRYSAAVVKNIKIAPSPLWMRRRLRAMGVRPINNIVDITNYVMLEFGQPMHAFDYSCVKEGRIIVRRASENEVLTTLDGVVRRLRPEMLLITDESGAIGIAGVMGGENSEITDATKCVVFESANFNGVSIRKTALSLGLRTDASGRFEKGLDPNLTIPALKRALELVELLGAGEVVSGIIDVDGSVKTETKIPLEPERINNFLGAAIDRGFMVKALERLGFTVDGDIITVPPWRMDVGHFADIAEEVARFYGFDRIEPTMPEGSATEGGRSRIRALSERVGSICRAVGYTEILTFSFTSPSSWDRVLIPENAKLRSGFRIVNPLGEERSVMRTTSLPSILEILSLNHGRRNRDVMLYELATIYLPENGSPLADERRILTLGAYGEGFDFLAMKGHLETIFEALRIYGVSYSVASNMSYHPGRCAAIEAGGKSLGFFGQIHPKVCEEFGIDSQVYAAEIDLFRAFECISGDPSYIPLPRYPAINRDIAIVCDEAIPVARLSECIFESGGAFVKECGLFDLYVGAPIPKGKKSVAFAITLRSDEETLTDKTADEIIEKVVTELRLRYDARLR